MSEELAGHRRHFAPDDRDEVRKYTHTPEELGERIERLRAQMQRTDRPESHLAAVDRELTSAIEQAEKRGIEVPAAQ
jgi:DNA-binding LacI/PurR family transcriptional regulator